MELYKVVGERMIRGVEWVDVKIDGNVSAMPKNDFERIVTAQRRSERRR